MPEVVQGRDGMRRATRSTATLARRLAAAMALAGAPCLAGAAPEGTGPASAAVAGPASPALAWQACRLAGLAHDALCATLQRPLDPARPGGPGFGLQVALLPALARRKAPDPVFFFAGGPGQSAVALAGTIERLLARTGERHDIVLIDQRGTGRSAPLQCDTPSSAEALERVLDPRRLVAAMASCRAARRTSCRRASWTGRRTTGRAKSRASTAWTDRRRTRRCARG